MREDLFLSYSSFHEKTKRRNGKEIFENKKKEENKNVNFPSFASTPIDTTCQRARDLHSIFQFSPELESKWIIANLFLWCSLLCHFSLPVSALAINLSGRSPFHPLLPLFTELPSTEISFSASHLNAIFLSSAAFLSILFPSKAEKHQRLGNVNGNLFHT